MSILSAWHRAFVTVILTALLYPAMGVAQTERAKRPFAITEIPEAGLTVYIPERPPWHWQTERRRDTHAVILSTPELYYPLTSVEIASPPNLRIALDGLELSARAALETVRESAAPLSPRVYGEMVKATYGDIVGYEEILSLDSEGQTFEARSFTGIFPSGRPVSFFAVTAEGQIDHIQPMLTKIITNLTPLP